jgi:hypothetical protein
MLSILYHAEHRAALDLANGIHYMESEYFEWDDAKAEANFRKHRFASSMPRRRVKTDLH